MKKLILILLIIGTLFPLMAQKKNDPHKKKDRSKSNLPLQEEHISPHVLAGLNAGPTIDWMLTKVEGYAATKPTLGFRFGIPVDIRLTEKENFYVNTGLFCKSFKGTLEFPWSYDISVNFPNIPDPVIIEDVRVTTQRTYTSFYLSIPTGIKLKTTPSRQCVFGTNIGLLHQFLLTGKKQDHFKLGDLNVETEKVKNDEAALFQESIYIGIGLEYIIAQRFRVYFYPTYTYTFNNYYNKKATNIITQVKGKASIHTLEFIFGIGL